MSLGGLYKVVMVDRHELLADCLGVVLEMRQCRFRKVSVPTGPGSSTRQVLTQVLSARPTVALVNANLGPHCSATALIAALSQARVPVLVLADTTDEARWGQCLELGARAVVPKSASLSTIVSAIRRLSTGQRVLEADERERLIGLHLQRGAKRREALERLDLLSAQERQILWHLMEGRTAREIAALRVVSEATVRSQVKAVLTKLEVRSQLTAVALAHLAGWEPELRALTAERPLPSA